MVPTSMRASTMTQQVIGTPVPFLGATDIALASNGDLFVADPSNHRICRIDRPTGKVTTVAGTGGEGFDSEVEQAAQSPLRRPQAIAINRAGDLYIADTSNNRVRVVSQRTGLIRTVAGEGEPDGPTLGDGGPAVAAFLNTPTGVAVAPNGDIYIADTGHNRVRKVAALTGIITTVAAVDAPTAIALAPVGDRITTYVIDSRHGTVKVIDPDGAVTALGGGTPIESPTRLAYHASGWLYVKDASPAGVTAVPVSRRRDLEASSRRPARKKAT
jgi:trimeric autotransporter adhesin